VGYGIEVYLCNGPSIHRLMQEGTSISSPTPSPLFRFLFLLLFLLFYGLLWRNVYLIRF
jgi:hypothetical protein